MAISDLKIRVRMEMIGREHLVEIVDRLEALGKPKPNPPSVVGVLGVAAVASASSKRFSRRQLFGFWRGDK